MESKKEIRKRIRKARAMLPECTRLEYSQVIQKRVLEHPLYQSAREIYCYVAFSEEAGTAEILARSRELGKKLAVPKIAGGSSMEFYYINSMDELEEGYFGIMEPATQKKAEGEEVLVIMPGVAFDKSCSRIGYGKGFYDSYLHRHPDFRRLAIAYSMQCLDSIPTDEHDIRPELIITEREIYTC